MLDSFKSPRATPRTRPLLYLIYLQAISLAVTYVAGTWLAITVQNVSSNLLEVIEHGLASSAFVLLTGVIAFLAALQGHKRVLMYNSALFFVTVITGSTGFALLGNPTDATQIAITNLSMMASVAVGMPITGLSLATLSRSSRGISRDPSTIPFMTYLALGALSLTIVAGAAVASPLYAFAIAAHVGLAALTVALVLGVLVISILEASGGASNWEPQRVAYSLLGLASVSVAGGDGVIYLTSGGLSYLMVMAEVAVLVYIFLMIGIGAPYRFSSTAGGKR